MRAFSETYRTELRAEGPDRARELYRTHAARYDAIATEVDRGQEARSDQAAALRRWRKRRILGKVLSVLRLLKAAFTFQDGAAYLASKIEQHSGVAGDAHRLAAPPPGPRFPRPRLRLYRQGR